MDTSSLFKMNKTCKTCGRLLPDSYKDESCPVCKENELFDKVREFVRSGDVTEYEVAEHFKIPLEKVKQWIREGRIEYKDHNGGVLTGMYCSRCGAPVGFGTLCSKCLKLMNEQRKGYKIIEDRESERMRFLDENK